ncbi:MAG: DNA polymerase III subunit delta [Deltaproteobacteria bacterium]
MEKDACVFLHGLAGNQLRTLYEELEKLYLRHGNKPVGVREIQDLAIYSRNFSIFELMDEISRKERARSLEILERYLEEEGKDSAFQIIGMLNRQIRLIFQTRAIVKAGGRASEVTKKLKIRPFLTEKLMTQSKTWDSGELERALDLLYRADGLLKTGSQARMVLENLLLSLMVYPSEAVS